MSEQLKILTLTVGQLQSNCYILYEEISKNALIIDPGDDGEYIQRKISDLQLHPSAIYATHGHFDHVMAVTELKYAYTIPFFISHEDLFLIDSMSSSVKYHLHIESDPSPAVDGFITQRLRIHIGDAVIKILETPGHTPGSVCFYIPRDDILFVGDLLFAGGGIGRTDFSYSNKKKLYISLGKVLKLPPKTIFYPGHGNVSTIGDQLKYHKYSIA